MRIRTFSRRLLAWLGRFALTGWLFVALGSIASYGFIRLMQPPKPFSPYRLAFDLTVMAVIFATSFWNAIARHEQFRVSTQIGKILAAVLGSISLFAASFKDIGLSGPAGPTHQPADALYFALGTWTTLGYGDFAPMPDGRILATIEGFLGYFYLGLLVALILFHIQHIPERAAAHERRLDVSDTDQDLDRDVEAPKPSPAALGIPDAADYWAHKIAEEAKKKVVTYFALTGVVVSLVVTLFGMDRIRSFVDEEYEERVQAKEAEASARIDRLSEAYEARLYALQRRAETRSDEFHRVISITFQQVLDAGVDRVTLTVDVSDKIGPIRDQGQEGTTVGFALAYALTAEVERETGQIILYSARSIYVEARERDEWPGEDYEGTSLLGGLTALKELGAYLDADWPYEQVSSPTTGTLPVQRIADFTLIPPGRSDLLISALTEKRPVVATINVTETFGTVGIDGRISISSNPRFEGGHAICIVGYDEGHDEFKFANMWGTSWGAAGYGFIRREDLEKILQEAALLTLRN